MWLCEVEIVRSWVFCGLTCIPISAAFFFTVSYISCSLVAWIFLVSSSPRLRANVFYSGKGGERFNCSEIVYVFGSPSSGSWLDLQRFLYFSFRPFLASWCISLQNCPLRPVLSIFFPPSRLAPTQKLPIRVPALPLATGSSGTTQLRLRIPGLVGGRALELFAAVRCRSPCCLRGHPPLRQRGNSRSGCLGGLLPASIMALRIRSRSLSSSSSP